MGARSSQPRGPATHKTDGHLIEYFRNRFIGGGGAETAGAVGSGLEATGGVISEYTDSGSVYRAHIFNSSGSFVVTDETSDFPLAAKVLVIAGGGGGGGGPNWAGGGGAGGLLETTSFTLAQRTYPIVIGGGGAGGIDNSTRGQDGGDTTFTDPGGPTTYTATGGGGGGAGNSPKTGRNGGSGGGGGENTAGGTASQPSQSPFTGYANAGGGSGGSNNASGGGGAGSSGVNITTKYPGTRYVTGTTDATQPGPNIVGGDGRANTFAYGPTNPQSYAGGGGGAYFDWDGPGGPNLGAGVLNPDASVTDMNSAPGPATNSGLGGGGKGGAYYQGIPLGERHGIPGTGGGGGGGVQSTPRSPAHPNAPQPAVGGTGGGGTVIVAYKIGETGTEKATGGAISYYNNKTIHTFTSSGTFATKANWSATNVEYVCVAGGGGSNNEDLGGGGGAGGFITGTTPIGAHPVSTAIQVGAGGGLSISDYVHGGSGTPSYFGTPLTAWGGGGGAGKQSASAAGAQPGGSGGGGDHAPNPGADGDKQTGTSNAAPITPQGYPGGDGASPHGTGGGGGAGGAGGDGANPDTGGTGGLGRQVPATFRNPVSATSSVTGGGLGAPGPTGPVPGTNPGGDQTGKFWFAGGGGGGADGGSNGGGGGGATAGNSYAGGGYGGHYPDRMGTSGTENTGGGGGATDNGHLDYDNIKGHGGSGIVLIAYPS